MNAVCGRSVRAGCTYWHFIHFVFISLHCSLCPQQLFLCAMWLSLPDWLMSIAGFLLPRPVWSDWLWWWPALLCTVSSRDIKRKTAIAAGLGGGDSSVVRAPDSWLKGRGFESLLERRENFLLQGRLSVLTLISVSVPPPCYHSST